MEWRDEGVLVGVRKHGETSAIIDVFTKEHGLHSGIVRGGASRRMSPILQIGAQVEVQWSARLEEHLGTYKVEPLYARSAVLADRTGLAALGAVAGLIRFAFPERMALARLYTATIALLNQVENGENWGADYALWELAVLEELGYGLDFSECAATGAQSDLIYISPKSGRAVSADGGKEWADRLLPLPAFFLDTDHPSDLSDHIDGMRLTGYFLHHWLAKALGDRPIPDARDRLVRRLSKQLKASS